MPYYEFREVLTVREADRDRFRTLADLRGRRVGTLGGTIAYDILLAGRDATTASWPCSYDDDVHPYSDLLLGRVDAVLLDDVLAERAMRRNAGLVTQPEAVAVGHYVGVLAPRERGAARPGRRASCATAMRDGTLERIFRKWDVWNDDQPRLYARVLAAGRRSRRRRDRGRRRGHAVGPGRGCRATCRRCCGRRSSRWCCRALSMALAVRARRGHRERARLRRPRCRVAC